MLCWFVDRLVMIWYLFVRCTFHGRLVYMRGFISKQKSIPYLCMVLLDGSGEIKAIAWRDSVAFWISRLKLNEIYTISHFKIVPCNPRFSRVMPGDLQLSVDKWTKVIISNVVIVFLFIILIVFFLLWKIETVKWCAGKSSDTFPRLVWDVKPFGEIMKMDLIDFPVIGKQLFYCLCFS